MKFFLDENETPEILTVLRPVFYGHEFRSAGDENLRDVEDVDLFVEIARRGFGAIITRDRNQLADPVEREALRKNRLHWIGHKEPNTDGINIITSLTAGYLSAFPHVLDVIATARRPMSFRVKAVPRELEQRVLVNPIASGARTRQARTGRGEPGGRTAVPPE